MRVPLRRPTGWAWATMFGSIWLVQTFKTSLSAKRWSIFKVFSTPLMASPAVMLVGLRLSSLIFHDQPRKEARARSRAEDRAARNLFLPRLSSARYGKDMDMDYIAGTASGA